MKQQLVRITAVILIALTVSVSIAQEPALPENDSWRFNPFSELRDCYNDPNPTMLEWYVQFATKELDYTTSLVTIAGEMGEVDADLIAGYLFTRYWFADNELSIPPCAQALRLHEATERIKADVILIYALSAAGELDSLPQLLDALLYSYAIIREIAPFWEEGGDTP